MRRFKIVTIILLIIFVTSCTKVQDMSSDNNSENVDTKGVVVSFIDVGQGDSELIKTPKGRYILIDSGSKEDEKEFFSFIKKQKIKSIDVLVGTHPHEDHIGNFEELIANYEVRDLYMPKVTANTSTFKNLMKEIQKKGIKIKRAFSGVDLEVDGVKFSFLAPNKEKYKDLNNYSGVLKMQYGDTSFLFMGDAEKLSESEILKKKVGLKADVIKIGHHGSHSSSSKKFIKAVAPDYAIISCGKNNDYGHPHAETLKLLKAMSIKVLRTDINGTIVFSTDGKNINLN